MAVRIHQEDLNCSIRTQLCIIQQFDSQSLEPAGRIPGVIHLERKMMIATRTDKHVHRISGRTAAVVSLNQVNQRRTSPEPRATKRKRGAWNFGHPQQTDVEPAAGFHIAHDQSDMVDVPDLHRGNRD